MAPRMIDHDTVRGAGILKDRTTKVAAVADIESIRTNPYLVFAIHESHATTMIVWESYRCVTISGMLGYHVVFKNTAGRHIHFEV